jgi:putative oligomerization/nucleic acid binding protein
MPLMRRRPLLRAAAVGGGAYMAGKHRAASQQREYDQDARISDLESQPPAAAPPPTMAPPPPPPPPPAPAAGGISQDVINQLTQLGQLHDQGVLTDEEFAAQKAKLLGP